jgi:aspartyl protease/PDZ domain-containing protein
MRGRESVQFFVCAFSAAWILSAGATAGEPQLPKAGCTSWTNIAALTLRGTSEEGGLRGKFRIILDLRSGRYVAERDYGVYSMAEGFDGNLAWKRDRSGASHFVDSSPARAITATDVWLLRRGWCDTATNEIKMESLPDEKDGDVEQVVWQVTPKGGIPVVLCFERVSGLLRQSEVHLWSSRLIRHYSDWRDIGGGVMIPFFERDEYPEDESVGTIKIDSAEVSPHPLDGKMFARPPRPHDYEIIGGKSSATVPYEDDGIGRIFVPVLIDGKGPFAFEVDTGGHLILTTATAKQLHLEPIGNSSATGGGTGVIHQGTVRADEIRIGAAVIRNQPIWVLPLPESSNDRGPRRPRAGILGLELFERFAVQVNRKTKTITLTPLENFPGNGSGVALPISFTEDAPLTRGSFNGIIGDFELDSGNAGPTIVEGYWAKENGLGDFLARGLRWAGSGIGGDYNIKLSRGDIALGSIKLPQEVVSYAGLMQRGSESTHLQAGVVGESSLYRFDMVYDYARAQVWIDPKTDIPLRPFNRSGLRLRKDAPDAFTVIFVAPNSPAEMAKIKEGDQISSINRQAASGLATSDAAIIFGRPIGTNVMLSVIPKTGGPPRRVQLRLKEMLR